MWTYIVLILLVGIIIGFAATRIALQPRLSKVERINEQIRNENLKTQIDLEKNRLRNNKEQIRLQMAQKEVDQLTQKFTELSSEILNSQQEKDNIVQNYYDTAMAAAKKNIQLDIEQLEANYTQAEKEYQNEYLVTLEEAVKNFDEEIKEKKSLLDNLKLIFQEMQEKTNAAVEANKRAAEIAQKADFYKLVISDIDAEEIKELRAVAHKLRNSEPLNKVIWKVYYERPYTDLIGRVIGSGIHCGIYKITNIKNGMCYVGQAVNIADRWKQHIRRGVGADPPTRNKLYPAMLSFGVENFTFEVIEECDRNKLNERELYWQDYFKAKEFGYSIK